jgi:hypothetical protein
MSQDTILIAFYVITMLDVLVAAGFAIAGLTTPASIAPPPHNAASEIFASYAAARALPLAFVVLVAIVLHATLAVFWLGFLAGLIQFADAYIGFRQHDMRKTVGPVVIGVIQLAAVVVARKSGIA